MIVIYAIALLIAIVAAILMEFCGDDSVEMRRVDESEAWVYGLCAWVSGIILGIVIGSNLAGG